LAGRQSDFSNALFIPGFFLGETLVKQQAFNSCLVALGLTLGMAQTPAGAASTQAIVSTETVDGSVELSNISAADNPESAAVEATAEANASAAPPEAVKAEPPKDPREQYRDKIMKDPEGLLPATSAVSRRYKMMDKATYQSTVLEPVTKAAPTPQEGGLPAQ
jgi:type IV secretory pathway VirB10-like protein